MAAAILLDKRVDATPTLGRISSAYPTGKPHQRVWSGPVINYPRPTSERSSSSGQGLGLHTIWDKFPAGVEWFARIGVRFGAAPYRIRVINQTVDGASQNIGLAYAEFVEDDSTATPYLALKHAGFTAPAAGTRVYAWTIHVTDCGGETTSVDVSLTVYAQDHASFLTHFVWFDPSAATNGTGTFASPCNTLSGPQVNSNNTVIGTSWAVSTNGRAKSVMLLCKGTGVMQMTGPMTSPPNAGDTTSWYLGTQGPRQVYCIPGSAIEYRIETGVCQRIRMWEVTDCMVQNMVISCAAGSTTASGINGSNYTRCAAYDITFRDLELAFSSGNPGAINGMNSTGDYAFFSHLVDDGIFTNEVGVNISGLCCLTNPRRALLDHFTRAPGLAGGTQYNNFDFRWKHDSIDCEARRMFAPNSASDSSSYYSWAFSTDAGNHVRAVLRFANIGATTSKALFIQQGNPSADCHSIMTHFCTLRGRIDHGTSQVVGVENAGQFHAYGNILENTNHATNFGWGTMDADYRIADGKSAMIENSLSGAVGTLLDSAGEPINSAHRGVYGHTVFE